MVGNVGGVLVPASLVAPDRSEITGTQMLSTPELAKGSRFLKRQCM